MPDRLPLRSLPDLARLALIASLLYLLWCHVAAACAATLVGPASWLLEAEGLPTALTQRGHTTVVSWPQADGLVRYFQISGGEAAYINTVAALALFLAIPGLSIRQRIGWGVALGLALWITHVAILYSGAYSAIAGHLSGLTPAARSSVLAGSWGAFSLDRGARLGDVVGMWTTWVSPAVLILVWLLASPASARRLT